MTESIQELKEIKNLLQQIGYMRNSVFGIPRELPTYCFSCGRYMGTLHLVDDSPSNAEININPLCRPCFKEKVGKIAEIKPIDGLIDHNL